MDRALVERARDGDHDAFAELARASSDRLYAVAMLVLRDSDRAKDAVQEALIAAWRGIRALREPDAWNAWLQRLVIRSCYRLARGERHRVVELQLEGAAEPRADDASVALADRDLLDRGFRRLPADQRAILAVHYYLGLPLGEAATVLGIPPGTAKSRLNRATRAMRAALEADARETGVVQERPA